MWGLEYFLLFGVPNNKTELINGRSRWAFPFTNQEQAEAHFEAWLETLCQWKQLRPLKEPSLGRSPRKARLGRITLKQYPRPIEMRMPMVWDAFDGVLSTFYDPRMWLPEWPHWHRGLLAQLDHQDVQMNLWSLFGDWCSRHGGQHCGRVDIMLSDSAVVAPDQFYFGKPRSECMISGDYFCGVPDLIAEVLAPASVAIDRGPRRQVYCKAGVPHLWLVDPVSETIEIHDLIGKSYRHQATYRPGEFFDTGLFPGEKVEVAPLFRLQSKRHSNRSHGEEPELIPDWIVPPDMPLGLEYFFLLGHPEHRWEIWGNRCPCVLAFGSSVEAMSLLPQFLEEACRWEQLPVVKATPLATHIEQAEVGRFRFTRSGRHIHLEVAVDARKYRQLLEVWCRRDVWDWGED